MFQLGEIDLREYSYKIKILKMLVLLISSVTCVGSIIYFEINTISVGATLGGLVAGFLLPYLFTSIVDLSDNKNWKSSQRKLKRAGLLQNDTFIRISFAYLFRIKIDGRYFLVQNTRTKKYQPVGGAYKFYEEETNYLADNIPAESDNRIPVNKITKQDYRLLVKSKDLRRFVRRFDKTSYRENINNLSREFVEELFTTNILDKNTFGDLSYKYCGRHMTNIEYGNMFNHYELLLADIIEVQLTTKQEGLFRKLMEMDCSKYRFAQADEIKSYGVVGYGTDKLKDDIANHTPKILSENTDKLILRNKHKEIIRVQL
ncbi:lysine 2,3-aminomutase [Bacillus sp. TS-2]|nr:lysine 2,3-aminomutase [Bacillus sp. TS-2]